jgi:hypothetical protein
MIFKQTAMRNVHKILSKDFARFDDTIQVQTIQRRYICSVGSFAVNEKGRHGRSVKTFFLWPSIKQNIKLLICLRIFSNSQTKVLGERQLVEVSDGGHGGLFGEERLGELEKKEGTIRISFGSSTVRGE